MKRPLRATVQTGGAILIPVLAAMLFPERAAAHLVQTGFGPLVDGIFHMLVGPDALLLALSAGLLCALNTLRGPEQQRAARAGGGLFLYGWAIFCAAGAWCQFPFDYPITAALSLALMGVLTAADIALPPAVLHAALGWAGAVYGIIAGGAMEGMERRLIWIMYAVDFVLLLTVFLAARALLLRFPRIRIGARVAGSWVTAIAMLQLGWSIRMRNMV